jgi:CubicO group peptidase (beta-lactamase class C family)
LSRSGFKPRGWEAVEPGPDADNPAAISPAGRVHLSLADFLRYVSWHARGPVRDVKLMSEANFQRLHRAPEGSDYAMGWIVTERKWAGGRALNHNGSNTMWYAVMWTAPGKGTAFVAVANAGGDEAFKACDAAVAMLIGRVK